MIAQDKLAEALEQGAVIVAAQYAPSATPTTTRTTTRTTTTASGWGAAVQAAYAAAPGEWIGAGLPVDIGETFTEDIGAQVGQAFAMTQEQDRIEQERRHLEAQEKRDRMIAGMVGIAQIATGSGRGALSSIPVVGELLASISSAGQAGLTDDVMTGERGSGRTTAAGLEGMRQGAAEMASRRAEDRERTHLGIGVFVMALPQIIEDTLHGLVPAIMESFFGITTMIVDLISMFFTRDFWQGFRREFEASWNLAGRDWKAMVEEIPDAIEEGLRNAFEWIVERFSKEGRNEKQAERQARREAGGGLWNWIKDAIAGDDPWQRGALGAGAGFMFGLPAGFGGHFLRKDLTQQSAVSATSKQAVGAAAADPRTKAISGPAPTVMVHASYVDSHAVDRLSRHMLRAAGQRRVPTV